MRFSFFPPQRYSRPATAQIPVSEKPQTLGAVVGKYDIQCTLHGDRSQWRSQWTKDGENINKIEIRGLLYFDLRFEQSGNIPLQSGTVLVDVGIGNIEPMPTVDTYTNIVGPPVTRQVTETRRIDPHINVEVPPVGLGMGGYFRQRIIDGVVEHRWKFEAGNPSCPYSTSVTQVEYVCHNAEEDHAATARHFKGAIVLSRSSTESFHLTVEVKAIPLCRDARIFRARSPGSKRSAPIGPSRYVEASEFQSRLDDLEHKIMAENYGNAAHEVPNTILLAPPVAPDPPANVATAITPETVAVPVTA
ncbi:hypothetical protein LTR17_008884 [Elasticomyces elasticus]|nr:hypothetical protein LTR17_008884 [Elasticomyces elasticus]